MHVRSTVEQKNWRILPAVVDTGGRLGRLHRESPRGTETEQLGLHRESPRGTETEQPGRSTVNRPEAQRRSSPGAPP